jgi:hypothetical protein
MWRVLRCAYHRKSKAIADLCEQGFVIHDTYLNSGSVRDNEEFVIVAKRVLA